MITLERKGKYALHLRFQINDINDLIRAFQIASEGATGEIRLDELAAINNKIVQTINITMDNEQDKLSRSGSTVTLELENETIHYILDRFKQCGINRHFSPAELCEVSFGKQNITVYGFLDIVKKNNKKIGD